MKGLCFRIGDRSSLRVSAAEFLAAAGGGCNEAATASSVAKYRGREFNRPIDSLISVTSHPYEDNTYPHQSGLQKQPTARRLERAPK